MYEMIANSGVDNLGELLGRSVIFRIDVTHPGWLIAHDYQCGDLYLRWGRSFPAEDHWSLWLGYGWFDFNDRPANWRIEMGDERYPWGGPIDPSLPVSDKEELTEILLAGGSA